ncbi:transaldolase [Thermoflexus sp.]|uniref:transaldolase n=1 Tax=Thermoflexus sp. TaxID=1969742 RepID=UPI0025E0D5A7|nr:transaldolase [Thermoflexus sp.]MDW8065689.1 transaldolase [Anaerolineae bacterium]MCS6962659.1 transaldolase [Thermoflexus sp.]MCS7350782.1 transaldolase [Thermoflexus sp.]MCX7689866.1 transaldolase [Thermoflexus sp.]MDW8180233.1 transaldolase [Anaerolineae bacterium]
MASLRELHGRGQSVWLDEIRREWLTNGELARWIERGVTGVTSNPTIFERAITTSPAYDEAIRDRLLRDPELETPALYEALAVEDIQMAADLLRPVYEATEGADGFVSLEVSPHLAHDTEGTIAEARRLWRAVDRPNLMIKVPATPAGIPAIEALIAEGVNVNVTLIFSPAHYEAAAQAYWRGLGRRAEAGKDLRTVASVASFFVSRIDTAVDRLLETMGTPEAYALRGKIAVAVAKQVYRMFRARFMPDAFPDLQARGARAQRVLWASTSTKNPAYSDVKYVEELIGPNTVNTMPRATLQAFEDHGRVIGDTALEGWEEAGADLAALARLGIDLEEILERLQAEGVDAFSRSYETLLEALERKRAAILTAVRPQEV